MKVLAFVFVLLSSYCVLAQQDSSTFDKKEETKTVRPGLNTISFLISPNEPVYTRIPLTLIFRFGFKFVTHAFTTKSGVIEVIENLPTHKI
mgnify:CR=1 FL=1